jgi:nucleotide-binding universal stress UspA family protein
MRTPCRILVPIDFSPSSRTALDYAADMAARFGAALDVLYVWQPPHGHTSGQPALEDFARTYFGHEMALVLERLEARHLRDVHGRLEAGDASHTILDVAVQGYDLIVLGIHCPARLSGLRHLVHPSVAARVVERAPCPVLTVRAPESGRVVELASDNWQRGATELAFGGLGEVADSNQ